MQVGRDSRGEGSLKSSGVEELSGRAQRLEQGRQLGIPCSFFCAVVNILPLSLNGEGSVWMACLRQCEPHERMPLAVCHSHFGEGAHPHLLVGLFPGRLASSLPAAECWWLGWGDG